MDCAASHKPGENFDYVLAHRGGCPYVDTKENPALETYTGDPGRDPGQEYAKRVYQPHPNRKFRMVVELFKQK